MAHGVCAWVLALLLVCVYGQTSYQWAFGASGDFSDTSKWATLQGDNPIEIVPPHIFIISNGNVTLASPVGTITMVGGLNMIPSVTNRNQLSFSNGNILQIYDPSDIIFKVINENIYPVLSASRSNLGGTLQSLVQKDKCPSPYSGFCLNVNATVLADASISLVAMNGALPLSVHYRGTANITDALNFVASESIYLSPLSVLNLLEYATASLLFRLSIRSETSAGVHVASTFNFYTNSSVTINFPDKHQNPLFNITGTWNLYKGLVRLLPSAINQIVARSSGTININTNAALSVGTKQFLSSGTINVQPGAQLMLGVTNGNVEGDIVISSVSGGGTVAMAYVATIVAAQDITFTFSTVVPRTEAKFTGQISRCTFEVTTGSGITLSGSSTASTFNIANYTLITGSGLHTTPTFNLQSSGSLVIEANVQGGIFNLGSGGTVTISGTCTSCTFNGAPTRLTVTGSIPQATINLNGGISTLPVSTATSIILSGGTHELIGNAASAPITVSVSAQVTFKNQFSGARITVLGGTSTTASASFTSVSATLSAGTFTLSAGSTSTSSAWVVTGPGSLQATSSAFSQGSITVNGTSGNFLATAGATFTGVSISCGGTTSVCEFNNDVVITASPLTVSSSATLKTTSLVTTNPSLNLTSLSWLGGNLQLLATIQTANLAMSAPSKLIGKVELRGATTWTSGDITIGPAGTLVVAASSSLNRPTGRILVEAGETTLTIAGPVTCAEVGSDALPVKFVSVSAAVNVGKLRVSDTLTFTAGSISNADIVSAGTVSVTSGATKTFTDCTLKMATFNLNGALSLVSTTLTNAVGGTMSLSGTLTASADSAIVNNGTLTLPASSNTVLSVRIENSGSFVNSGNLTINGKFSCNGGTITAQGASAIFAFSGQALTLTSTCQLLGLGTFAIRNIQATLGANLASANLEVAGEVILNTQNISKVLFTSGSITGSNLVVANMIWTAGRLNTPTTVQNLVLAGDNMQLEANMTAASTTDSGSASKVLFTTSGRQLVTTGATTISGQVNVRDVIFVNRGAFTVASAGRITIESKFDCVASASLQVNGYFAIDSVMPTFLACAATGSGTLATYSQLNISSTFAVANLLIANTTFSLYQPVSLQKITLNNSQIEGSSSLAVSGLVVGPGDSTMNGVKFSLTGNAQIDGNLKLDQVVLTCAGTISLNAGAVFHIGGDYMLNNTCQVIGQGILATDGDLTIGYKITVGGLRGTGGTLTLPAGSYKFGTFELYGAQLVGNIDMLNITSSGVFSSISFSKTLVLGGATTFDGSNVFGNVVIEAGGVLSIIGGQHTVETFDNSGSVSISTQSQKRAPGDTTLVINNGFDLTGTLDLAAGQIVNMNGSVFTATGAMSGSGSFVNNGSFLVYSSQYIPGVSMENYGSIEVNSGALTFGGTGGALVGLISVAPDAELRVFSGSYVLDASTSISGNGTFSSSGNLVLNGIVSTPSIGIYGGSIDFGTNNYAGSVSWFGGQVKTLRLSASSLLNVVGENTTARSIATSLFSLGVININAPLDIQNGASLTSNGSVVLNNTKINGNGNIRSFGSMLIPSNAEGVNVQAPVLNYGPFIIAGKAELRQSTHSGPNASVVLASPRVSVIATQLTVERSAVLYGSGSITGRVTNNGSVVVGNLTGSTVGNLTVFNYYQEASGVLYLDVVSQTSFDRLNIQSRMDLIDSPTLIVNASYDVASAGENSPAIILYKTRFGNFTLNTTNFAGGLRYSTEGVNFVDIASATNLNPTTATNRLEEHSGLPAGKIAGIVVGVIVGILIIAAIAMFIVLRRKDREVAIKMEALEPEAAPTEEDALEHSFDFYTYQVISKEHNRLGSVVRLHDMLLEDNLLLVDTIVAVTDAKDGETINFVAKSLTYLLESKNSFLPWFERMLQDEVNNCLSKETLFRGNNMFTKSMTAYAIMVGTRYLQTTLFEPMQKLATIAEIQSPELDPNRVQNQADLELSKDVLQLLARLIFTSLQKSIPNVPIQIQMVCNYIKSVVVRKYPDSAELALGGFFFLRFLNPVIVSPDRFGITKASADATVRRAELLVSKVMMTIVNGVLFGEKEAYLAVLNDFVEAQRDPLFKLLTDLTKVDAKASQVQPIEVPRNVTEVSLAYIHKQIATHIDGKIKNYLNCVPPPPPKNYVCPPELLPFFSVHYPNFATPSPRATNENASLILASSSSQVNVVTDEHTRYTTVLRQLSSVSSEQQAARHKLYEKLKTFLAQVGTQPLGVQGEKDGKKVALV